MPTEPTALVLTPGLGGDFFGDLLAGIAREIVGVKGHLVVVETLQEHAPRDEAGAQGNFSKPVGWEMADGVISITTAVNATYLQCLRDAGKPVALLSSTQVEGFEAPNARPDNRGGMAAAVEHLIAHGHTRIGFVGNLAQRDLQERYEAYVQVLESHGFEVDPALTFETPENGETGGASVTQHVLAVQPRPTALVVGTDRNAIGLMDALQEAGVAVPLEIAIAAYDNMASGTFSSPPLTSVEARFDEVGAIAARLALGAALGHEVANSTVMPDSVSLMVRASCGCGIHPLEAADEPALMGAERLRCRLRDALMRDLRTGDKAADEALQGSVDAIAEEAAELLDMGPDAPADRIEWLAIALERLTAKPGALRRFADAVSGGIAPRVAGMDDAGAGPADLAAAVWKAQAGASLHQAERTDAAIGEQYIVDAGLLDTSGDDPRSLKWLASTHVKAAVLGLWTGDPAAGELSIVGEYAPHADVGALGTSMSTEQFPPRALVERAVAAHGDVCVVVPVSTHDHDWGLLALVADLESSTERETYQHWAALLSAALESQRRQEEVRRSALFDALTGLPNRQLFIRQLDQALARWQRSRAPYAVLFMDLDGFKLINDSLGHQMGDRVLQAAGAAINGQLRAADTASRFGGDEFVILLADSDADQALAAAQRIQAALAQVREFDGHEVVTRASIGIASSDVAYFSAEDVLRDADSAMYRAKAAEPGSIAFFDEPMHAHAIERAALAREVLGGLTERQFEVHYQPIVNLASGRTDRFEALLRWRHPERGMLAPHDFLPAIEDTAFIVQLGHWVIDEVCRQLVEWGDAVVNVSINISDKEFWSQDLLRNVLATLERYNLEPGRLTLEITESVLMRRPEMALRMMSRLHEAGLRLHIDDFGTGFSSLETLHRFPVDAFKIDRTFIQTLTNADNSAELIESLVKLGKALGLAVVAEGVETDDQLDFLRELGCATGQGFLFMPAVTADRAKELLSESLHTEAPSARG